MPTHLIILQHASCAPLDFLGNLHEPSKTKFQ